MAPEAAASRWSAVLRERVIVTVMVGSFLIARDIRMTARLSGPAA
jgi:hypothetical protein